MSLDAFGTLHEPVRRRIYECVAAASAPVGRDEVAAVVGIGRTLAAFHLDKLAAAGLVEVSFARRSGRTGPGAGRPAKLYVRSTREHMASLPPRDYRGLAELLADAVEEAGLEPAVYAAAGKRGAAVAAAGRASVEDGSAEDGSTEDGSTEDGSAEATAEDPREILDRLGYEPVRDGAVLRLRNCPFDAVAKAYPPVVCGANLAFVQGALGGTARARLDPGPDGCCVVVECKNN